MFILVFIDIYLFFSILWVGVGDTSPIPPCSTVEARDGIPIHPVPRWKRGMESPYILFHGGSESGSESGGESGRQGGVLGMRVGGMRDILPHSPIVEPGG